MTERLMTGLTKEAPTERPARLLSMGEWKLSEHVTSLLVTSPQAAMHEETSLLGNLPYLYTAMQYDGDSPGTAAIREQLIHRDRPPLPLEALTREVAELTPVFDRIPNVQNDPQHEAALQLASNALFTLYTLYGDPKIGTVNQIVGTLEQPGYAVRAFYHNAFGVLSDMHDLQTHFDNLGNRISTADRLDGVVADLYTDIIYGNGRMSDTPNGYDELLSAKLLYRHARQLGYSPERAGRLLRIVLGTRFSEKTKSQPGRFSDDLVVQAVTAIDLHGLAREGEGVPSSQDIALENLMSRRYHLSRVLGRAACQKNTVLHTRQEGLDFTREYYDLPVEGHPTAATLGEAYEHEMLGSADFHRNYRAPETWTLPDLKTQNENADAITQEALALAA